MSQFQKLKSKLASLEEDADKFYNRGIKAAGPRVRAGLLEIKNLAGEARKEIAALKKAK